MRRVVFSPRAKKDIDEIWNYTTEHWNVEQAELYLAQIRAATLGIGEHPEIGISCDDIRPGYRKRSVGFHVIFYRVDDNRVEIIRILHGRMDFAGHFR